MRHVILSFTASVMVALGSVAVPTLTTTPAFANSNCGGLNQRVCKKWEQLRGCDKGLHRTSPIGGKCTRDNKFIPDAIENVRMYEPSRTNCGGLNQRVCKKTEQLRGCDPGFHRTLPVGGICTTNNKFIPDFVEQDDLKQKAKEIADAMMAHQRVMKDIASCVSGGQKFREAIETKDIQNATDLVFACVTPEQIRILMQPPLLNGAAAAGFRSISVGVGASSMFGAGLGGEAGVVLSLEGLAAPRFYTSGGMKFGFGAGVSGDVIAGISVDGITPSKSDGIAIGAGGKAIGGAGVGVFFSNLNGNHRPFSSFSVSAGAGAGFEIGTVNPTWSRIW